MQLEHQPSEHWAHYFEVVWAHMSSAAPRSTSVLESRTETIRLAGLTLKKSPDFHLAGLLSVAPIKHPEKAAARFEFALQPLKRRQLAEAINQLCSWSDCYGSLNRVMERSNHYCSLYNLDEPESTAVVYHLMLVTAWTTLVSEVLSRGHTVDKAKVDELVALLAPGVTPEDLAAADKNPVLLSDLFDWRATQQGFLFWSEESFRKTLSPASSRLFQAVVEVLAPTPKSG